MKYIALLGMTILVLGLGTVNFQHHINLPEFDKHSVLVSHNVPDFWHKTYDIRLNDEIKGQDTLKNVMNIVSGAHRGDIINFHLAGYGGQVETALELINLIKTTKATVNMMVEGNVYSAHAYIAVSGNTLSMAPYTYMMFHTSSLYGLDCSKADGQDRTVSNVEHCITFYYNAMLEFDTMLMNIRILDLTEKRAILSGHDVYLTSQEFYRRALPLEKRQ